MLRRLDLASQLPARGLPRVAVVLSLVLGGAIAVGLTALIAVFVLEALRG